MKLHKSLPDAKFHVTIMYCLWAMMSNAPGGHKKCPWGSQFNFVQKSKLTDMWRSRWASLMQSFMKLSCIVFKILCLTMSNWPLGDMKIAPGGANLIFLSMKIDGHIKLHKSLPDAKFHEAVMYSLWATMSNGHSDWLTDWQTEAILIFHFVKPKWNKYVKLRTETWLLWRRAFVW